MEDFYNVSVTAEKWLNITEHGFQRVKKETNKNPKSKGKNKPVAEQNQ